VNGGGTVNGPSDVIDRLIGRLLKGASEPQRGSLERATAVAPVRGNERRSRRPMDGRGLGEGGVEETCRTVPVVPLFC